MFSEKLSSFGLSLELLQWITDQLSGSQHSKTHCQWSIIWSEKVLITSFNFSQKNLKKYYASQVEVPELYSQAISTRQPVSKVVNLHSDSSNSSSIIYLPVTVEQQIFFTLQGLGNEQELRSCDWYLQTMTKISQFLATSSHTTSLLIPSEYFPLSRGLVERISPLLSSSKPHQPCSNSDYFSHFIEVLHYSLVGSSTLPIEIGILFTPEIIFENESDEVEVDESCHAGYFFCRDMNNQQTAQTPSQRSLPNSLSPPFHSSSPPFILRKHYCVISQSKWDQFFDEFSRQDHEGNLTTGPSVLSSLVCSIEPERQSPWREGEEFYRLIFQLPLSLQSPQQRIEGEEHDMALMSNLAGVLIIESPIPLTKTQMDFLRLNCEYGETLLRCRHMRSVVLLTLYLTS